MSKHSEQIKALQYLFDVARTAPAPAAVHEQVKQYAQFLANSFTPAPFQSDEAIPNPVVKGAPEKPKTVEPVSVAAAVAEATKRHEAQSDAPAPAETPTPAAQ